MTSKKPAQQKRANLPRRSDRTGRFVKDWERLSHSGRYDMRHLKEIMLLLIANDAPLPPEYRDHELVGEWAGFRECHIGGDFLLIYDLRQGGSVIFARAGTHADLFE
jgi:mRNA interferase YafQ